MAQTDDQAIKLNPDFRQCLRQSALLTAATANTTLSAGKMELVASRGRRPPLWYSDDCRSCWLQGGGKGTRALFLCQSRHSAFNICAGGRLASSSYDPGKYATLCQGRLLMALTSPRTCAPSRPNSTTRRLKSSRGNGGLLSLPDIICLSVPSRDLGGQIASARQASFCEIFGRPRIDEHGGLIRLGDAHDAVQLDDGRASERTPHRHSELIAPNIGEACCHQLLGQPSACLAIGAIAVDNERGGLVAVRDLLHGRDLLAGWRIDDARTRNMTGDELGTRARIDDDGASVCEDASAAVRC